VVEYEGEQHSSTIKGNSKTLGLTALRPTKDPKFKGQKQQHQEVANRLSSSPFFLFMKTRAAQREFASAATAARTCHQSSICVLL
jgi:hypothetical protein